MKVSADDQVVKIGNLYYDVFYEYKFTGEYTAIVWYKDMTSNDDWTKTYNEGWDIVSARIPSSVQYDGKVYKVKEIKASAFENCRNLKYVEIPNTVQQIGNNAFAKCPSLKSITCKAIHPPYCRWSKSDPIYTSVTVYVPDESIDEYKKDIVWKRFKNIKPLSSRPATK